MSDSEIIETLKSALRLAEATLMKLNPTKMEERIWIIDAVERSGKALAAAEFLRQVRP